MADDGTVTPPAPPATPPPASPPAGYVPQDQVTRIATQQKEEGERAARAALLKELGIDDPTQAAAIIRQAREADERGKSEAQKAREAADAEKAAAASERQQLALERHESNVERVLLRAGAGAGIEKDEDRDAALTRLKGMVTVQPGATPQEIHADVEQIKAMFPALFTTKAATPPAPGSDPAGRPPRTGGKAQSAMEAGAERAKSFASQAGVSYAAFDSPRT